VWRGRTLAVNAYGPSECGVLSTVCMETMTGSEPSNIGSGVGCVTWIVDPADHERLVPIGAVGELLIEGPIVGRGYLGDPEKTAAAFVEDPPWLLRGGGGVDGRRGRLYKTGDLVRYASDGSLVFVGRKDTQVKVRGQRVELGEVEHHVRQALPEGSDVVAEVVRPESGRHEPMLVAFVRPPASPTAETDARDVSESTSLDELVRKLVAGLDDLLESALPRYMVPSAYVPVDSIPTTATGKTDRKRLRETAAAMTAAELAGWRASIGPKRRPTTDVEQQLATLWAQVLGVDADTIGLDDSFFRLGGDSIAAMKLVAAVRTQDFALTVADVFSQPLLCNQARLLHVVEHSPSDLLHQPFTAVSRGVVAKALADSSLGSVSQQRSRILDAAPVTSYQHYSVTHTINKPRVQLLYLILTPSDDLDPSRLVAACKELVNRHEILRTVFIPQGESFIQLSMETIDLFVLVQRHSDDPTRHSRQICIEDADEGLDLYLGMPWIRFWVVQSATQGQRLIIRLSHAQYDGISLPTIVNDLEHLCYHRSLPLVPSYAYYLSCLSSIMTPQCQSYWDRTLAGSSLTGLPTASRGANGLTNHAQRVTSTMRIPIPQFENLTVSTILQAAWALVISQVMSTDDVVFGQLVSGRNVQMPQVHRLVGCCINIIPVRVRVNTTQTYRDLIQGLHKQKIDGSTYESCQLPDIIEHATNWPQGSRFSWIVQHQNIQMDLSTDSMAVECFVPHMERADAADEVYLFTEPKGHELEVSVSGRKSRELLIYQLKDTLRSILAITSKQPSLPVAVVQDASLSCASLPIVRA
jgi:aryl carrier-like protein